MTVIVKNSEGKIICMTKGADSIIIPRLKTGQDQLINKTLKYVEDYANEGLRTLLIAQK